jgi:creatinine amidohydrolase
MTTKPLHLEEMTWPEVQATMDQVEIVLIPVGATEQHGPNLSLRCDTALAEAVARRLEARHRPRALVVPAISFGISRHHMGFPGTITLSESTLVSVAKDVVASLMHHGLRRFLFINGHGGNGAALNVACAAIKHELEPAFVAASTYYASYDPAIDEEYKDCGAGGHACGMEVSLALSLCPELVRRDALAAIEPGPRFKEGEVVLPLVRNKALEMPFAFDELTSNGCFGDARKANKAYGDAMVESLLERMSALIELAITEYP